ncbi:MAG: hypothetical protein LEGION0403_FIIPPAGN_02124 [Legionella sp.]|uniref:hypothetical protein n=1 Tax=Legionella sp. TaxID=459 RepID=UPI003D0C8931
MKKNILSFFAIFACCVVLSSCGINATTDSMTYSHSYTHKPVNKNFIHGITVSEVKGGHTINPLLASEISNENFKAALEKSLQHAQLSHGIKPGTYSLKATIVRFERPVIGLDFKSTLIVNYKLFAAKEPKPIFDKTIKSSYVAKMSDSLIGVTRLKMANEGAARENIKLLIKDLYRKK